MILKRAELTHKIQEINLFTNQENIDLAIIAESRLKKNLISPFPFHNTLVNIPAKNQLGGILAFSPLGKLNNAINYTYLWK